MGRSVHPVDATSVIDGRKARIVPKLRSQHAAILHRQRRVARTRRFVSLGLVAAVSRYGHLADHHKYRNNLDYGRSVFLINRIPYTDAGCLLIREDPATDSRIGVLHVEKYSDLGQAEQRISEAAGKIQCVVGAPGTPAPGSRFGDAQRPRLWEYADNVDTMEFLIGLKG